MDWASWTQFGADGLGRSDALLGRRRKIDRVVDRGGRSVCMRMARGNSSSRIDSIGEIWRKVPNRAQVLNSLRCAFRVPVSRLVWTWLVSRSISAGCEQENDDDRA